MAYSIADRRVPRGPPCEISACLRSAAESEMSLTSQSAGLPSATQWLQGLSPVSALLHPRFFRAYSAIPLARPVGTSWCGRDLVSSNFRRLLLHLLSRCLRALPPPSLRFDRPHSHSSPCLVVQPSLHRCVVAMLLMVLVLVPPLWCARSVW